MSTQLTPRYHTCAASKTAPKRASNRRSPRIHSQILPPPTSHGTLDVPPTQLQPRPSAWHQHEGGMELDVAASPAVRRGTTPVALPLKSQSDEFLSLNLHIDAFWERLRLGYAQDLDFRDPPRKYFFDMRLHVYFYQGKLVIPNHHFLRRQVLLWHHVHPWHAHMGISRTASLVTQPFYWPCMRADIKKFVSQCHSCTVMKSPTVAEALVSPPRVPSAC